MEILPRKGTGAVKFDGLKNKYGISDDSAIPLWIVDIDITEAVCLWRQGKNDEVKPEWITCFASVWTWLWIL